MGTHAPLGAGVLVCWAGVLVLLIAGLGAAGHGVLAPPPVDPAGWSDWLAGRTPVEGVFALGRAGVLAAACYLLAVTVLGVLARAARMRWLVAAFDRVTLPALRRLLDTTLGLGLMTAMLAGVAAADPAAAPDRVPADTPSTLPPRQPDRPPLSGEQTWTVTPGDHFWGIAANVLTDAWPEPPSDPAVAGYWHALIEHNRAHLADPRNPDLIHPGEVFRLPPVSEP